MRSSSPRTYSSGCTQDVFCYNYTFELVVKGKLPWKVYLLYFTCNHDNGRHLDGFATLDSRANSNIAVNKSEFAVTARTAAPLIWLDVDNHIADISHSWGVNVNPVGLSTVLMADEFDMNSHLLLTLILLRYQYWIATMGEWIQPQLESGWSNPNLNFSEIY